MVLNPRASHDRGGSALSNGAIVKGQGKWKLGHFWTVLAFKAAGGDGKSGRSAFPKQKCKLNLTSKGMRVSYGNGTVETKTIGKQQKA